LLAEVQAGIRSAHDEGRIQRGLSLWSLAFLETMAPPKRPLPASLDLHDLAMTYFPIDRCMVHALGDSTCQEVNAMQAWQFVRWRKSEGFYHGDLAIGEYYNLGEMGSLPVPLARLMGADIPWYYAHGARDFFYMHVPTLLWGPFALNHAVYAR